MVLSASASGRPRVRALNTDFITKCLFVADAPVEADIAIVLGNTIWTLPAAKAVELYRSGRVTRLLFTGGPNRKLDDREANKMARFALDAGVPAAAILVEPEATNTEHNFVFARQVIETEFGGAVPASVLVVAIHFHIRRAILAARRHLPPDTKIGWVTYPSIHYEATDWSASDKGRSDVMSEIDKIGRYYAMALDDLAERGP